jgi:hypothetical protein
MSIIWVWKQATLESDNHRCPYEKELFWELILDFETSHVWRIIVLKSSTIMNTLLLHSTYIFVLW